MEINHSDMFEKTFIISWVETYDLIKAVHPDLTDRFRVECSKILKQYNKDMKLIEAKKNPHHRDDCPSKS